MKNLLGIAVLGLAASMASASTYPNSGAQMNIIQPMVKSISASGSYFTSNGNHATNLSVTGSEFVNQNIEVILGLTYADANGSTNTGIKGGARYYWGVSQDKPLLPFAGVFYQYNTGSGFNSNSLGVEIGIQYFVAPNVSVTPSFVWANTHGNGNSNTYTGIQFGLTYWFK